MTHKCTNCGHVDEIKARNQVKGGKSRWKGMTAKERSLAASKAAKARWAKSENVQAHLLGGARENVNETKEVQDHE